MSKEKYKFKKTRSAHIIYQRNVPLFRPTFYIYKENLFVLYGDEYTRKHSFYKYKISGNLT